jgi:hypothetical protein
VLVHTVSCSRCRPSHPPGWSAGQGTRTPEFRVLDTAYQYVWGTLGRCIAGFACLRESTSSSFPTIAHCHRKYIIINGHLHPLHHSMCPTPIMKNKTGQNRGGNTELPAIYCGLGRHESCWFGRRILFGHLSSRALQHKTLDWLLAESCARGSCAVFVLERKRFLATWIRPAESTTRTARDTECLGLVIC